ncbi:MAG: YceH family protein [Pseudomonadota bacterium]
MSDTPPDTGLNDQQPTQTDSPMLSAIECRILGALMEKQLATPDNYPLTVNSLISAANQKSSREPVSSYQQGEVVRSLRELEERRFVRYEMGARSEKYEQRFTSEHSLSRKQQALLCVMMLRGPQTVGELQTRTQRLYEFTDRADLMVSLERLTQGDTPMVVLIPRQAGQRDDRYGHLLCGAVEIPASTPLIATTAPRHTELQQLQQEVDTLRQQLHALYELTGHTVAEAQN